MVQNLLPENMMQILVDERLDDIEKMRQIEECLCLLTPSQMRFYSQAISGKPFRRSNLESDLTALVEFDNLNEEFMRCSMGIANIGYLHSRLEDYPGDKDEAKKFIEHCFGKTQKHFYEKNAGEITTSLEQFDNLENYYICNFEKIRDLTHHCFGIKPEYECSIFVHGVFNKEDMIEYRNEHHKDIREGVYAIPLGKNILLQAFSENLNRVVEYNPNDPEYEKLCESRNQKLSSRQNSLAARLNNESANKLHPDEIEQIYRYKEKISETDCLDTKAELMKQMESIIASISKPNEVLLDIQTKEGLKSILIDRDELKNF